MKKYFFLFALVSSFSALANSQLSLNMKLNPAGSFEAKTDEVRGASSRMAIPSLPKKSL